MSEVLTLAEAQAIIRRAIEKAHEVGRIGSWVIVDVGGNVISISRMDGAPVAGVAISRAKAYLSAVSKTPTKPFGDRMNEQLERWHSWQAIMPQHIFPGPGGMPIVKNGQVVGGISTGPSIHVPGIDRRKLVMENGEVANTEDFITAYALNVPYKNQHGPSTYQWVAVQAGY